MIREEISDSTSNTNYSRKRIRKELFDHAPYSSHEVLEVVNSCDVIVVYLKLDIWVDVHQGSSGRLHLTQT